MDKQTGPINKMHTQAQDPVQYALPIGDGKIALNGLLGGKVRFRHTGRIFCIHCGAATKSSFAQGYCYRCMQTLAQCDMCIVRPETCHHHLGTCREPAWGETHCMIEHTVYLANSSGIKVGITRSHQVKTRWMDQGAVQALPIVRVKTRRDSGLVEAALSRILPDKTNWRVMLRGEGEAVDLKARRDEVFASWSADLPGEKVLEEIQVFRYPVLQYPAKPASLNLDKQPEVTGELLGIKGQYLILTAGVINMRKYAGYELEWETESAAPSASPPPASKETPAPAPPAASAAAPTAPGSSQLSLF